MSVAEQKKDFSLAKTIAEQLRWGDSWRPARWAARNYGALRGGDYGPDIGKVQGGLAFQVSGTVNVKRGGRVGIYLLWDDTYTVQVATVRGVQVNTIALRKNVYCDELGEVIDNILDGKN